MEGKTMQKKYDIFLEKYKEGVKRVRKSKHMRYDARCAKAKKSKVVAQKKFMKQQNANRK
ncbi:hypothetical protein E2C01_073916 [Portunus trituberculatus]|uniref:Uncharacterized protein n=1 Tax=Portunus trituberculatus TaxID=210409 RepID=A0A5B7I486_PORTR|nr:hypothetical protein [Portunus trituberculatus]